MTTQAHIKRLSARLEKTQAELEKRDFADVSDGEAPGAGAEDTHGACQRVRWSPVIRSEEELRDAKATESRPISIHSPKW